MYVSGPAVAHSLTSPQVTRHQGGIESLFHESMATKGLVVQRPVVPTSIELSEVVSELENPHAYPVKVGFLPFCQASNTCANAAVAGYVEAPRLHR